MARASAARRLVRWLGAAIALALVAGGGWLVWNPYAVTERSFDRGRNGLWVGHQWYTGVTVRGGRPVSEGELAELVETLREKRIRYVFVHVGPALADGSIADSAGPLFSKLRQLTPEVVYLGWLGGLAARQHVEEPEWRSAFVSTVRRLGDEGFAGVHLNIEPLEDHHPGYLELLEELRRELGREFVLSQATRHAGPFGLAIGPLAPLFWSESFYKATMRLADQTVLMAYDTKLDVEKHYVGFVKYQTRLLVEWGCEFPNHTVLIGLPAYEDVPLYSNPLVENIRTASQGVRAALEEFDGSSDLDCFEGVSVYAHWVVDDSEWDDFRRHWLEADGHTSDGVF